MPEEGKVAVSLLVAIVVVVVGVIGNRGVRSIGIAVFVGSILLILVVIVAPVVVSPDVGIVLRSLVDQIANLLDGSIINHGCELLASLPHGFALDPVV